MENKYKKIFYVFFLAELISIVLGGLIFVYAAGMCWFESQQFVINSCSALSRMLVGFSILIMIAPVVVALCKFIFFIKKIKN